MNRRYHCPQGHRFSTSEVALSVSAETRGGRGFGKNVADRAADNMIDAASARLFDELRKVIAAAESRLRPNALDAQIKDAK